jgi:hypothetical protein
MSLTEQQLKTRLFFSVQRADSLLYSAFADSRSSALLEELRSKEAEYYLVGGAVRDLIQGAVMPRDIDLIVPNGDEFAHRTLRGFGPSRRNRHGNWRYQLSEDLHVDVIEPRFFYRSFENASDTLSFFDASVNAIGVRLFDGHLLNPINGLGDLLSGEVTLPTERWQSMDDFESVHLTVRLTRLLKRLRLRVVNPELALAHLPKYKSVDWDEVERLNGVSRWDAEEQLLNYLFQ